MAKILYVVSRPLQINTSASIRNKATIAGLLENGHEVDLITTLPDKNHMAFDSSMELKNLNSIYIKLGGIQSLVKIGRRMKFIKLLHRIVGKVLRPNNIYDNFVGILNHTNEVNLASKSYDYIISSSDPKSSHLFVEKLLNEQPSSFNGKWIQIWGDPFYDDITLPSTIDKDKVFKEESRLLTKADKIIYVSKLTLKKQQRRYSLSAFKMEYHPIPYNKKIVTKYEELKKKKLVSLAYCGDYASTIRNIKPLYEAVNDQERLKIIICGGTDVKLENTINITIKPRQSLEIVEKIEQDCDILVHLSNLYGSQIPGKLYQYSGTNKPILFILDGEKDWLRTEFNQYERYVFAENNKESIREAINSIIFSSKNYEPVKNFSKKYISSQILKFE